MKKKFFLVGALVVMSMSAMFVACNGNNPTNGCECTATIMGESQTGRITLTEMKDNYGVTTCSALASTIENRGKDDLGFSVSVSCKAY